MIRIKSITLKNYKCFSSFKIHLNEFNILVGPNNAGKSTIIGALKILAEGIKKAKSKKPTYIEGPDGKRILGYTIDLSQVPVATENIFHNYDDKSPAIIRFDLSDDSCLQIFFRSYAICYLNYESNIRTVKSPKEFREYVKINIGFVPILGPVDHKERLYQKEAARAALMSYTAARNFRNIWYHYPENFAEFKTLIKTTWPGMDIDPPEVDFLSNDKVINMFCAEDRSPRELFWSGFGFQVWCQMLTFLIQNKDATLFLIDEPDIYLHSELQRQLLGILKSLGPAIVLATHSTEMIGEAELNDILIINKAYKTGRRIKDPSQLQETFQILGSNLNPLLTQIAKSRRVLFLEGKDFTILSKVARILKKETVANRMDYAVISLKGYNPARLRAFKEGIENTIGSKILSAVVFDRDYRSDSEVKSEMADLKVGNYFVHIHSCKELENFLLSPKEIELAIQERLAEARKRGTSTLTFNLKIEEFLDEVSSGFKHRTQAQLQSHQLKFEKGARPGIDEATISEAILNEFDLLWTNLISRLMIIPGKEFITALNVELQQRFQITISSTAILNNFKKERIHTELVNLIDQIESFRIESLPNSLAIRESRVV